MSDENKPHDDHGHDAGNGRDEHAPAPSPDAGHAGTHDADAGHGDAEGHDDAHAPAVEARHDEPAPDAHPVADAHAADHAGHGHEAHVEAAHGDHDPAVTPSEATMVAGAAGAAAASSKAPVWSDSGDAPFEDVDATPVYARGKKGRKKGKSGGNETVEIIKTVFFALLIAFVLRVLLFQPFTIPSASMEPNLYEGDYIVVSKWSYGYSKHAIPFSPPLFEGRVFAREPGRGDIVVFKLPRDNKTDYIKRLVGLPGDRVQMINNVLHINDEAVRDVVISGAAAENMYGMPVIKARETLPGGRTFTIQDYGPGNQADDTPVFQVPEGYYFMMGDNRDNSVDSRFGVNENGVGLVPAENLIGKAEIILFSWKPGASLWNPVSWFSKVQPSRFFTDLD
jgi:signal peptidase I